MDLVNAESAWWHETWRAAGEWLGAIAGNSAAANVAKLVPNVTFWQPLRIFPDRRYLRGRLPANLAEQVVWRTLPFRACFVTGRHA
jgi:hypothetical protein